METILEQIALQYEDSPNERMKDCYYALNEEGVLPLEIAANYFKQEPKFVRNLLKECYEFTLLGSNIVPNELVKLEDLFPKALPNPPPDTDIGSPAKPIPDDDDKQKTKLGVGYIGASVAADVCGFGYGSQIQAYLRILGLNKFKPNKRSERGHQYEAYILGQYEQLHNCRIINRQKEYTHPQHNFMRCHVDGVIEESGFPIDAKLVDAGQLEYNVKDGAPVWGESGTDIAPITYVAQIHDQMLLTGATEGHLAVLFVDHKALDDGKSIEEATVDFRVYIIKHDENIAKMLLDNQVYFWTNFVAKKTPPPVDFERNDALDQIRLLYPDVEKDTEVVLDDDALILHQQIIEEGRAIKTTKNMLKAAERKLELTRAKLEVQIGGKEKGVIPGVGAYHRKKVVRKGYTINKEVEATSYIACRFKREEN